VPPRYEIEIKLRLPAALAPIRRKLRDASFVVVQRRVLETNVLFDLPERPLGQQGKLIRVRRAGPHAVLTYKGPPAPGGTYKKRPEIEVDVSDGATLEEILGQIGYQPIFRYQKFRTEYARHSQAGKIMLDETPIGNFLEVEGAPRWIDRTARLLGFSPADYITSSYGSLYLTYCREHGIAPTGMLFRKTNS
jgi:adenylate cyclase class 2